jgi:hypothetical protein
METVTISKKELDRLRRRLVEFEKNIAKAKYGRKDLFSREEMMKAIAENDAAKKNGVKPWKLHL